jgi:hypothetical protein
MPGKKSRHGLSECISLRGESKLEGFHDLLANFANVRMRYTLTDAINLIGTARWNVARRYKIQRATSQDNIYIDCPCYWANEPQFFDESELHYINGLALDAGYGNTPFPNTRTLPPDNGERFFMRYWIEEMERQEKYGTSKINDRCQCPQCAGNPVPLEHFPKTTEEVVQEVKNEICQKTVTSSPEVIVVDSPQEIVVLPDTPKENQKTFHSSIEYCMSTGPFTPTSPVSGHFHHPPMGYATPFIPMKHPPIPPVQSSDFGMQRKEEQLGCIQQTKRPKAQQHI